MTVISETVADIAGADDRTVFAFASATPVRTAADGTGLITGRPVLLTATGGVLTTPGLDPGPAVVRVGPRSYSIDIPDSPTPILLSPLIEAGLPVVVDGIHAVVDGGGVRRIQRMTQAAYDALVTPDPETLYVITAA